MMRASLVTVTVPTAGAEAEMWFPADMKVGDAAVKATEYFEAITDGRVALKGDVLLVRYDDGTALYPELKVGEVPIVSGERLWLAFSG